jgi:hypothetical protein
VFVELSASALIDLYSKTSPLNLYDSKFAAIFESHGNKDLWPGLMPQLYAVNDPAAPVTISPMYSL